MSVLNAPTFTMRKRRSPSSKTSYGRMARCARTAAPDRIYPLKGVRSKASKKNPEGVDRLGLKKCGHCRKQFTARVGTVFESSHIPLHNGFRLRICCAPKKGISSHQLHRILKVTYQAAWFASHRLREAMRTGALAPMGGGGSGIVEIDETIDGRARRIQGPQAVKERASPTRRIRTPSCRSWSAAARCAAFTLRQHNERGHPHRARTSPRRRRHDG